MELGPIWRSMLRNKGGFTLIAVQIAVTMTIMANAVAIIQQRSGEMARPSRTRSRLQASCSSTVSTRSD